MGWGRAFRCARDGTPIGHSPASNGHSSTAHHLWAMAEFHGFPWMSQSSVSYSEKVHRRSLNLSSSYKIVPKPQNRIYNIPHSFSLDPSVVFIPVLADGATESAWNPRGPHLSGCHVTLPLSLSPPLPSSFLSHFSPQWAAGRRVGRRSPGQGWRGCPAAGDAGEGKGGGGGSMGGDRRGQGEHGGGGGLRSPRPQPVFTTERRRRSSPLPATGHAVSHQGRGRGGRAWRSEGSKQSPSVQRRRGTH